MFYYHRSFPFNVFNFGGNVESSSRFVEPHLRLLFRDGGELGLEKTTAEHWTHRCFFQLGWWIDMNSIRGEFSGIQLLKYHCYLSLFICFLGSEVKGLFLLVKLMILDLFIPVLAWKPVTCRSIIHSTSFVKISEKWIDSSWFIHTRGPFHSPICHGVVSCFSRGKVRYLNVWLVQNWEPFLRI